MILPVINIGTGYQIGLMWSSPLTQGIKISLLGYGGLLRLSQGHMPIVFYDRPAFQAEARTFFFFFACQLSTPNQTGYIRGVQYCNRVCIWMFLVRYIVTGCIFRAPSALWQGQSGFGPPPPSGTHFLSSWEVECPPPPGFNPQGKTNINYDAGKKNHIIVKYNPLNLLLSECKTATLCMTLCRVCLRVVVLVMV